MLGGKPGTRGSGVPGKRVGYMPQEIALYGEFSIRETMMYFGWIFGMGTKEIMERLQFLLNFLDLPSEKRLVKNLSGGQQRRVSFAVALMHDPELLILDEPTVGVDPLLRQSIWNHLVHITKAGQKTVIITTHYIEEARQAHTVRMSGRVWGMVAYYTVHFIYLYIYCFCAFRSVSCVPVICWPKSRQAFCCPCTNVLVWRRSSSNCRAYKARRVKFRM